MGTTPTADDVLIRVSRGETVVSAADSKKLAPQFKALGVPGYAAGGTVGASSAYAGNIGGLAPASSQYHVTFDNDMTIAMEAAMKAATAAAQAAANAASAASAGGKGGISSAGVSNSSAEAALRSAAAKMGWTGAEWTALFDVEMREAGFSLTAQNPSSGAYGMAQFINGAGEYAQYGGNSTTAAGQATAMVNYIAQRYGTPEAAWAHEECVTLDSMILTRTGWKPYDQVVPGKDETIGWNPDTGQSEWTLIQGITCYEDAPLVRLSNKTWEVECTPSHRWATRHWTRQGGSGPYRTEDIMTEAAQLTSRHSVRLAAKTDTGTGPAISQQEAELLGWVMGDGSVARIKSKKGSNPDYWRTGNGALVSVRLYQSKPEHVRHIDALVAGLLFDRATRPMRKPSGEPGLPLTTWEFSQTYSGELLKRSGYDHRDPVPFVLSLSPAQREAFMRGVFGAEGSLAGGGPIKGSGDYRQTKVYMQNDGPQQDALVLGIYLNGFRPGISEVDNRGLEIGRWTISTTGAVIRETKPFIGGEKIQQEDAGHGPVWCPQTALGTWTIRQGRNVMLTGNSYGWYKTGGLIPRYAMGGLIPGLATGSIIPPGKAMTAAQATEAADYATAVKAVQAALAKPAKGSWLATGTHAASVQRELKGLTTNQSYETSAFGKLKTGGLTTSSLSWFKSQAAESPADRAGRRHLPRGSFRDGSAGRDPEDPGKLLSQHGRRVQGVVSSEEPGYRSHARPVRRVSGS